MKEYIKKIGIEILVLIIGISNLSINTYASEGFKNTNELLQFINGDIKDLYGLEKYYKNEDKIKGNKLKLREELLAEGLPLVNKLITNKKHEINLGDYRKFRIAYGSSFTLGPSQKEQEYYGYSPIGALVENPNYHWNSWSGKKIQDRTYIYKPWENNEDITVRSVKIGPFNKNRDIKYKLPDGTYVTLADAIQTGLNIRFGGKMASDAVYNCSSTDIVYDSNAQPSQGGEWIDYVDIIQPPTYYSWGQGYMYFNDGTSYMGVDIAPYCIAGADIGVAFDEPLPSKTKTGDQVSITAHSISTFKKNINTNYRWTVVGTKTGQKIEELACKVNDKVNISNGECTIPMEGKSCTFKLGFIMPEEPVTITLEINYKEPYVDEGNNSNNTISYTVDWQPYIKSTVDYTLQYNELSREIECPIAKSGSSASVSISKGSWSGDADGRLDVSIGDVSGILQGAKIKEGTNDPVTGNVTSATRNPVLTGTIVREDFGDDPDSYYAPNSMDSVLKSFTNTFSGIMSRPWEYTYTTTETYTDSEGKTQTKQVEHTESGISTGDFVSGESLIRVKAEIYNGLKNMPQVDSRLFKNTIEDNTTASLKKIVLWESDKYPMSVQRWMTHIYLSEPIEYEAVDGQYERMFSQQNKATITWNVDKNMETIYKNDRKNAKNGKRTKSSYQYVPFATDKELQAYDYPFKSGYYFNPAGQYSVTVETEIFKDEQGETLEHQELVNEVIKSFRYTSTMQYKIKGSPSTLVLKIEDPDAAHYEDGLLIAEKEYDYNDYEVMYSSIADGFTHKYFKEILEGYTESNTINSKNKYQYREYIKEGNIYKMVEKTTITFKVNPDNQPVYTYGGMKNGTYHTTAWVDSTNIADITNVAGMTLEGIKNTTPLDHIKITVQGSMYDDLNN